MNYKTTAISVTTAADPNPVRLAVRAAVFVQRPGKPPVHVMAHSGGITLATADLELTLPIDQLVELLQTVQGMAARPEPPAVAGQ